MWDPFDLFDSPESHRKPIRLPLPGKSWGLGVRVFGPANDGKSTRVEEEQRSESSGILKKFRGRFAMARLKVIESRFGFRYAGRCGGIETRFVFRYWEKWFSLRQDQSSLDPVPRARSGGFQFGSRAGAAPVALIAKLGMSVLEKHSPGNESSHPQGMPFLSAISLARA